ncbi:MAG: tRNA (guanosine(37)-N1)-methyltransferase TrmD [Candidatus Moraniibacteriota bacterium]
MNFEVITIFPHIFDSYFNESILARAQKERLIKINIHNLRDYATDKHKTVDDTPYGGGAGMVLKVEPIFNCVEEIKKNLQFSVSNGEKIKENEKGDKKNRIILFSAKGKRYTQSDAQRLAEYENLIFICGRYEGVDERVAQNIVDEEISIGEYVLTGGEIPAMTVIDSISRLLPGVLGNQESLSEESFNDSLQIEEKDSSLQSAIKVSETEIKRNSKFKTCLPVGKVQNSKFSKEYPHYTKPEEFNGWRVPEVLLSGNHKEIEKWKKLNSL